MKITIECTQKEIADLAGSVQDRQRKELLEKQFEMLSKASKLCLTDRTFIQHIPAITAAMTDLDNYLAHNYE